MMADGRSASAASEQAGSDLEPAAKRRRTHGSWDNSVDTKPFGGSRWPAMARLTSAGRSSSDAAHSSQDADAAGRTLMRSGSSLGRRRTGTGGAGPKGGASGRRLSSGGGGAAAPITSLIEVLPSQEPAARVDRSAPRPRHGHQSSAHDLSRFLILQLQDKVQLADCASLPGKRRGEISYMLA